MKQFLLSLKKRKQDETFNETQKLTMIKFIIRLPVEWQILFALLLLMVIRLAMIVGLLVKQL